MRTQLLACKARSPQAANLTHHHTSQERTLLPAARDSGSFIAVRKMAIKIRKMALPGHARMPTIETSTMKAEWL